MICDLFWFPPIDKKKNSKRTLQSKCKNCSIVVRGKTGLTGKAGFTGCLGLPGEMGTAGEQGMTGMTGNAGSTGLIGSTGVKGDTGITGTGSVLVSQTIYTTSIPLSTTFSSIISLSITLSSTSTIIFSGMIPTQSVNIVDSKQTPPFGVVQVQCVTFNGPVLIEHSLLSDPFNQVTDNEMIPIQFADQNVPAGTYTYTLQALANHVISAFVGPGTLSFSAQIYS